jgi:hypothetical protein
MEIERFNDHRPFKESDDQREDVREWLGSSFDDISFEFKLRGCPLGIKRLRFNIISKFYRKSSR